MMGRHELFAPKRDARAVQGLGHENRTSGSDTLVAGRNRDWICAASRKPERLRLTRPADVPENREWIEQRWDRGFVLGAAAQ